jgi:hypothetical protein
LLFIINICPTFIKNSTPLSHTRFIHYTFTYSAVSCLLMSIARTFCAFKKRITDRTSQSAGLSIFLFILNSH